LKFVNRFSRSPQIQSFTKICPVGAEFFHADRHTHTHTHTHRPEHTSSYAARWNKRKWSRAAVLQSVSLSLWPPVLDLSGTDTKLPQSQLKNSTHASYDTFSLLACVTWLQFSSRPGIIHHCFQRNVAKFAKFLVVRTSCGQSAVGAEWGGRQTAGCNLRGGKINVTFGACKCRLDVRDFDRFLLALFQTFVTGSDESLWDHVGGNSAHLTLAIYQPTLSSVQRCI